jgi:hypothetical protein
MAYVAAAIVYLTAMVVMVLVFGQLVPKTYIEWARRHPWGRELTGILMTSCALVPAFIVFWLAH